MVFLQKKDGRDVLEEINRPHSKEVVNVDFVRCPNINHEWVIDFVCTYHICPHKEWFTTFKPLHNAGSVLDLITHHARLVVLAPYGSRCLMA